MKKERRSDRVLLGLTLTLVSVGLFFFFSAALGYYPRSPEIFHAIIKNQLLSIGIGVILLIIFTNIPYSTYKKFAFPLLIATLILTLLVHVPFLGQTSGGATRWLVIGGYSIQPSEFLKIASVIFYAAWFTKHHTKLREWRYSLLAYLIFFIPITLTLMSQPDAGTILIIALGTFAVFTVSQADWTKITAAIVVAPIGLFSLTILFPYIRERLETFMAPNIDTLGDAYQINQSLIAIGSGGWLGRGYGQSIQKFAFLPEPVGDSIFAVIAEEWGFIGTTTLILLFLLFAWRALYLSSYLKDEFGRLLMVGLTLLMIGQVIINVAALTGLFPLSGMPLIFISHGGSAMLASLIQIGIMLNITKHIRIKKS